MISTHEALAVLISLKVFFRDSPPDERKTKVQVVLTWTDSRGNGPVLIKLLTTCFPASAVVLELAAFMKERGLKAAVLWAPRETNREADAVADVDSSMFNPALRQEVRPHDLRWLIQPSALEMGRKAEEAQQKFKSSGHDPKREERQRKRKAHEKFRITDPW